MQAGSMLALDLLQGSMFWSHCMKAGAKTRQPLHLALSLQLTAVPGPLLSLCLGASPPEVPASSSPGPMPKPRPARGLQGGRAKNPVHMVGEDPCQKPGLKPRTGEALGQTCRWG